MFLNVLVFNVWLPKRKKEKREGAKNGWWPFTYCGNHFSRKARDLTTMGVGATKMATHLFVVASVNRSSIH